MASTRGAPTLVEVVVAGPTPHVRSGLAPTSACAADGAATRPATVQAAAASATQARRTCDGSIGLSPSLADGVIQSRLPSPAALPPNAVARPQPAPAWSTRKAHSQATWCHES